MLTPINIAIVKKDGSVVENHVYFDGKNEYVLKTLQENYSDYESVYKLCNYSFFVPPKKLLNFNYLKCKILNIDDKRLYFKSIEDYNRFRERWTLHPFMFIYMNGKWINYKVYRTGYE